MTFFGQLADGRDVHAITITAQGLSATILTYGAILQDVRLDGIDHSLTVGSDKLSDYETIMPYHGAIVGPVANRIKGARVVLDGIEHMLDPNLLGRHTLHGGRRGLHNRIWQVAAHGQSYVELTTHLLDGEAGFPANRTINARFDISQNATLTLTITTTSDGPTIVNATNHSYWCLGGVGRMDDHELQIHANQFLPTDATAFPTGEIADVAGTPFDFRAPTPLTFGDNEYDNTFCLSDQRADLTVCLELRNAQVSLIVATTESGVHIYDDAPNFAGLAIETQSWPDATNHPHFPSINAYPDAPVVQVTQWKFEHR